MIRPIFKIKTDVYSKLAMSTVAQIKFESIIAFYQILGFHSENSFYRQVVEDPFKGGFVGLFLHEVHH